MGRSLRVVTLNSWGIEPPLDRRLALTVRQLRALSPDVVCLQEARPLDGVSGRTTAEVIAGELGLAARYAVSVDQPDEQEGLAVLARTIGETRVLALPEPLAGDPCILLSARVATGGGEIWVHTTHLHHRLDAGVTREQQVLAIDEAIRGFGLGDDDPPQILCGDMNAVADSDEMRFLRGLTTLAGRRTHFQDAWLRMHREPMPGDGAAQGFTWSSENAFARSASSLDIDRRIDYVYVTSRKKDGRATVHDCRVVLTDCEGADEVCASDHFAVMADVQVVSGN
jgi:endonuclease/exonuclease/phosphatase family metal-dependent hydrolase